MVEVSSLSLSFSDYLPTYLSMYVFIYRSLSLFHLSICLAVYLSICLSIYLSLSLSLSLSLFYLSSCLPVDLIYVISFSSTLRRVQNHLSSCHLFSLLLFNILTWKCASRHNGVHFFNISTSKSGPNVVCFVRFDLEMCFVRQRRALFRHLNFQKCSENGVFCIFDFQMCFAPQRRATFHLSSGQMAPHPPL